MLAERDGSAQERYAQGVGWVDRAALESAGCDPRSVREAPELLDAHGSLLVAVPVEAVNGRALTIDLTTLTFRLGSE